MRQRLEAEQALPDTVEAEPERPSGPIRVGDIVWVHSLSASGQVHDILNEREAEVQVGSFRLKVLLNGLELRERPQPATETTVRSGAVGPASTPGMELDLRGMRVEETLALLDDYIDSAYLAELPWVRIIHGKGTGALRQVVRDFLRNHPVVSKFRSGEQGEGGEGVTVAYFVVK